MGKEEAFAVGLLSSVKNMAIMVAAVIDVVEPMIALVVICAQLPIFFTVSYAFSSLVIFRKKVENLNWQNTIGIVAKYSARLAGLTILASTSWTCIH